MKIFNNRKGLVVVLALMHVARGSHVAGKPTQNGLAAVCKLCNVITYLQQSPLRQSKSETYVHQLCTFPSDSYSLAIKLLINIGVSSTFSNTKAQELVKECISP